MSQAGAELLEPVVMPVDLLCSGAEGRGPLVEDPSDILLGEELGRRVSIWAVAVRVDGEKVAVDAEE